MKPSPPVTDNLAVPLMLIDGEPATPAYWNRAALYGDGLFETMLWVNGAAAMWPWHWARLTRGCSRLGLNWPDEEELLAQCQQILAMAAEHEMPGAQQSTHRVIRLTLFRSQHNTRGYRTGGSHQAQCLLSVHPMPPRNDRVHLGQSSVRLGWQPLFGGLKHLNRLEQVMAASECEQHGWEEALVLDQAGRLVSAVAGNVIFRRDLTWMTPPVDRCGIAGVTRQWAMEHAGFPIPICTLNEAQLELIDEIWVINSVMGARWAASFNGRRLECSHQGLQLAAAINQTLGHPAPAIAVWPE